MTICPGHSQREGSNAITRITVRSYVPPAESWPGFDLGTDLTVDLPSGTTVGEMARRMLGSNVNRLGLVSVEGRLVKDDHVLLEGEKVSFFQLLDGG
ncbi:MAG: hypothetical protein AB1641_06415 [Thermodesulfobacteriota bacterium]